jgi:Peptidase family M28
MKQLSILIASMAFAGPVLGQDVSSAVNSITPEDIRAKIGVIAHDSMQGRNTPSPGLDMTAAWIADQFQSYGLAPGGDDGSFIQHYPLERTQLDLTASSIAVEGGPTWRFGTDASWWQGVTGNAGMNGRVAIVWGRPTQGEVTQLPVDGMTVIVIVPTGGRSMRRSARGLLRYVQNAGGAIVVTGDATERWANQLSREDRIRVSPGWGASSSEAFPVVEVKDALIAPVLAAHGMSLEEIRGDSGAMQVRELPELSIKIKTIYGVEDILPTPNTVGILDGSDPELKNEYVVFSAHMDHVGTSTAGSCREIDGDGICNGADDDASGTIGIVELAEAFSMVIPRPRRSIIFVTVSGEEKGLWGSDYFALNPGVPRENIVANVNADMIGRNWTDTIVVIGKEHSDLGATLNEVNSQHPELNMTAIDDIWPDQNFYRRSDHFNFAKRGIPILFFFNGTHENYHRPSDQVELIDAEKESRIVKLMFYLGLEIANKDARPEWNPESYAEIVQPVP